MRVVTLIPLSKRAKQIIKQHGERWEAVRIERGVLFTDKIGPLASGAAAYGRSRTSQRYPVIADRISLALGSRVHR